MSDDGEPTGPTASIEQTVPASSGRTEGFAGSGFGPWPRRVLGRIPWREVLGHDVFALAGLWSLAVTQPQLDLLGRNPDYFVSVEVSRAEIVAIALFVTFAGPLLALAAEVLAHAIRPGAGRVVHSGFVVLFAAMFVGVQARTAGADAVMVVAVLTIGVGIGVAVAERKVDGVRQMLRYLSVAGVAFFVLFLVGSETSALLWEDEAKAEASVTIGKPAPVVWFMFDEFPVATLLRADGTIDAERYPNFARLAKRSTFYRNATSQSWGTTESIPASLTGIFPKPGQVPNSISHPKSIFTLLGGGYDFTVDEQVTAVCPSALCDADGVPPERWKWSRLRAALGDLRIVYGHQILPSALREDLPQIDNSWGDFGDATAAPTGSPTGGATSDPFAAWFAKGGGEQSAQAQGGIVLDMIDGLGDDPTELRFAHVVMPHYPWVMTPEARMAVQPAEAPRGFTEEKWDDDEAVVRFGFQREAYQIGYVDHIIGRLIDELERNGMWDETMVIIGSDHGASFRAGGQRRLFQPENADEIFRPPLFVHYPGQDQGGVDDRNARLIDILPTVVEVLDIDTDWRFDGVSLLADDAPAEKEMLWEGKRQRLDASVDGLLTVAARNAAWMNGRDGWDGVVSIGRWGRVVGRPVDDFEVRELTGAEGVVRQQGLLQAVDLSSGLVPMVLTGEVTIPPGTETNGEALVAIDGVIAGVVVGFDGSADRDFYGLVGEHYLHDGAHDVALFLPSGDPDQPVLRAVALAEVPVATLEGDPADRTLVVGGRRIPIGDGAALRISLDSAKDDGRTTVISGWAGDVTNGALPDQLLVMVDGRQVDGKLNPAERADVADVTEQPTLVDSGFDITVDTASYIRDGAEVVLVAVEGNRATAVDVTVVRS